MAFSDTYSTPEGETLSVPASGVLGNDFDPDGDPLSAVLVSTANSGQVSLQSDGSFSYTPFTGFVGQDSFSYSAFDGVESSNTVVVTLDVTSSGGGSGGSGGSGGGSGGSNGAPTAENDNYTIEWQTQAIDFGSGVLFNDGDPENDPLTAVLESSPSHGQLVFNADGSFTYTPNSGYVGGDSFTYHATDGTNNSPTATVTLNVIQQFSSPTNLADLPLRSVDAGGVIGVDLQTGDASTTIGLGGGVSLEYHSLTTGSDVVVIETTFDPAATVPDTIETQLTVNNVAQPLITYSGSTLFAGAGVRFASLFDGAALDTGRYSYTLDLTTKKAANQASQSFSGSVDVVNRTNSVYGVNWTVSGLSELVVDASGVLLVRSNGSTAWFSDLGGGTFASPDGPLSTSTLVRNADNSYTLTSKFGTRSEFNANGLLTSRVDLHGAAVSFAYIDADADGQADDLATITDPFGRTTTFQYTNGTLSSVTDFAGRVTTINIDAAGRLVGTTAPDPDGTGPLAAAALTFSYNTDGLLSSITDSLNRTTSVGYDHAQRATSITNALNNTTGIAPIQSSGVVDLSSTGSPSNPASLAIINGSSAASVSDPMGYTQTYETDRFGNPTKYTNQLGFIVEFQRDPDGRVTQRTDPDPDDSGPLTSPVTTYTYNAAGDLTQTTFPDNTTSTAIYDPVLHLPTSVTDRRGFTTTFSYEPDGDLETVTDPLGNVTRYTYNGFGQPLSVTSPDPDGPGPKVAPITNYHYDALGRPDLTTLPDGSTIAQTYDAFDNVEAITDQLGRTTTFVYDNIHRLLSTTLPDPDGAGPQAAPVVASTYDIGNRVTSTTDPAGNVTSYSYDAMDQLLSVTLPDPDGAGPQQSPVASTTWDANGRRSSQTDPLGNITYFAYDGAGRMMTSITFPDPDLIGPQQAPVYNFEYDNLGRRTRVTDPLGRVTNTAYDSMNRITRVTDPAGGVTQFTYDANGNRLTTTDPLGRVVSSVYDALNRITSVTQPDPDDAGPLTAPVTTFAYDNLSRRISVTDPLLQTTTTDYDALSRVVSITDPLGNTTAFGYDAVGNRTSVTDPLGHVTTTAFDNLNRATSVTDAEGGVTSFTYDILGKRTSLTDPVGNTSTWAYDSLGRMVTETNPLGASRSFDYDANGNLIQRTDRLGRIMRFSYDNLGRMFDEQWLEADGVTEANRIFYTFDVASQLTAVSDDFSSYAFTYDALGRAKTIDNNGTPNSPRLILTNVYDAVGNRTSLAANVDGTADFLNSWQYDNLNRATRVTQTSQSGGNSVSDKRVDLTYNARGQFSTMARYEDLGGAAGVALSTYGYDDRGRIISLDHTGAVGGSPDPTTLAHYTWTWDAANRITSMSSLDGTSTFSYDDTSQLTGAVHDYQTDESYSYDANGNRLVAASASVPGGSATYTTGANNRLLSDGTYSFTYDAEGNRTSKTTIATGESVEYSWDHRNRLTGVTFKDSSGTPTKTVANTYDVQNRRIVKTVDNNADGTPDRQVAYLYDTSNKPDPATGVPLDDIALVYVDPDASGPQPAALDSRLLHGPAIDQIFASESATGEILWSLADHQGTVRDWLTHDPATSTTSIVNHLKFDTYGNITAVEDGAGNSSTLAPQLSTLRYAYTGRDTDPDLELQSNRARWYDPTTGRWISEDPLGFGAGDSNISRYVGNNPMNAVDPSGQYEADIHFYGIYIVLRARGWNHTESYEIAGWSQYLDNDDATKPVKNGTNYYQNAHFHFWGSTAQHTTKRNPTSLRERIRTAISQYRENPNTENAVLLGSYLHTFADTWAHEGYTSYWNSKLNTRSGTFRPNIGHADAPESGEAPDHPYRDIRKTLEAMKKIYSLFPRGTQRHVPWKVLEVDLVWAFNYPNPKNFNESFDLDVLHERMESGMQTIIQKLTHREVKYKVNDFANRRIKFLKGIEPRFDEIEESR